MKAGLMWVLAIVGGAAVGAVGGTAWLVYTDAPIPGQVEATATEPEGEAVVVSEPTPSPTVEPGFEPPLPPEGTNTIAVSGDPRPTPPEEGTVVQSLPVSQVGPQTSAPPPTEPTAPEPTVNHERLGRIFAAMKPEEAAAVLGQLDDAEIQGILMTMQPRNAAPILAELDPARAASLSRRVLGGRAP